MSSWLDAARRRLEILGSAMRAHLSGAPLPRGIDPVGLAGEADLLVTLIDRHVNEGLPFWLEGISVPASRASGRPGVSPVHGPLNGR